MGTRSRTVTASLTSTEFTWEEQAGSTSLNLLDILRVSPLPTQDTIGFAVTACPLRRRHWWSQVQRRVIETHEFYCSAELRSQFHKAFATLLHESPKQLAVIVNAASGGRKGAKILERLRPLFAASRTKLTVAKSGDGPQTRQFIRSLSLAETDGLMVVGGDGTVHDVINGLMERPDAATAIQTPIGVIPAGTGNGLCQSLLAEAGEPYDVLSAGFAIAKGHPHPLDLLQMQQGEQRSYGSLSLAWGLISDSDLASDHLRWLGPLRNDICALLLIALLRSYPGYLVFEQEGRKKVIEDSFITLWAMNVPWATSSILVAPQAQLADGHLELLMVRRGASRWRLIQAFLQLDTGGHIQFPEVECFQVQRFLLTPHGHQGTLALDGESASYDTTEVQVLPQLGRFFSLVANDQKA